MKINNKVLYLIIIVLGLALIYVLTIQKYNNNQRDLGKIELMDEIFELDKIPRSYIYCPDIDWKKLSREVSTQLSTQYDNSTLALKTEEALNAQRKLCEKEKLQVVYTDSTITEILQSIKDAGYQQCVEEAKNAGLI